MKKTVILAALSFLLQAAHSLRSLELGTLAIWIILPFLFLKREAWMRLVLSLSLLSASLIWILNGASIIHGRMDAGVPWLRFALIIAQPRGFNPFIRHAAGTKGQGTFFLET